MRFKAFPISVVVDGALREPALIWATDDVTEVWVSGVGGPERVASWPPTTARVRAKGEMLSAGARKAMFALELAEEAAGEGQRILVGKSPGCGCGHPLKTFRPPQEVPA